MDHGSFDFVNSLNDIAARRASFKRLSHFKVPISLKFSNVPLYLPAKLNEKEVYDLQRNNLKIRDYALWYKEKDRAIKAVRRVEGPKDSVHCIIKRKIPTYSILVDLELYYELMGDNVLTSIGATPEMIKMLKKGGVAVDVAGNATQSHVTILEV